MSTRGILTNHNPTPTFTIAAFGKPAPLNAPFIRPAIFCGICTKPIINKYMAPTETTSKSEDNALIIIVGNTSNKSAANDVTIKDILIRWLKYILAKFLSFDPIACPIKVEAAIPNPAAGMKEIASACKPS